MLWLATAGANGFAASPSGWVTGVGLPVAVVFLGWRLARADRSADQRAIAQERRLVHIETTQDAHTEALSAHSAGLQVMLAEVTPMRATIAEHGNSIGTLQETTATLKSTLETYMWLRTTPGALPGHRPDVRDS